MKPLQLLACLVPVCHVLAISQFPEPPVQYRPKFRYWLPDASVPTESVLNDIQEIATVGGGGLEFLSFYNYGLGPAVTDWSVYGFGTDAFNELFHAALSKAVALELSFDFALGPNQASGVPSEIETPGLAKELVYGNTTVRSGQTFVGKLPEPNINFNQIPGFMNPLETWGSNELKAVVAGQIVSESLLVYPFYLSVLDEDSLVDLTKFVSNDSLTWTAPSGNGTWVLFAFYERYSNQRSTVSTSNATTALGNGSWIVDHWSADGAKKVTDFWDQEILSDAEVAALVRQSGGYAWEDSIELQAALPWTPDFFSQFQEIHGYDMTPYLPVLFHATNSWGGFLPPYNITYAFGPYTTDGGPYLQDYKSTLSKAYLRYVDHFTQWASSNGFNLSNQPGYNFPVDVTAAVPHVQVPELESLGFKESINEYRKFTGAAHLAGRNVISTEVGAVEGSAYKLRITKLKNLFDQSFAAGVNTMVIHGYAYSGEYFKTTWPGYTPFQFRYSELWNQRQPAWRHLDDLMAYSARNSMIMRSGVPKIDAAFYYYENPYSFTDIYTNTAMNKYGYTFEFLGPENLVSEQAVVVDGVLAPEGPAFKALVIYNQTQITPEASAALLKFAENGLPIYIVGTIPNTTIGTTGQQQVSENINELLKSNAVHVVDAANFSGATLVAAGIPSRARIGGGSDASNLYTFWTTDADSNSEYAYLYNEGTEGAFNVTFSVSGDHVPYILDAWTGSQLPLANYEKGPLAINMTVGLRSNQTKIIAFMAPNASRPKTSVVANSANVETVKFTETGQLEAWISGNSSAYLDLSDGSTVSLLADNTSLSATTDIGSWNLTVEAYGPYRSNPSLEPNITTIDVGTLESLIPWTEIPAIAHASGVGTYRTRFEISTNNSTATLLSFGPVLNTIRAKLNDKQMPAIDPTNPVVDISDLIVDGSNLLEVEVTTSLFNAVKANLDIISSIGYGAQVPSHFTDSDWEKFGLIGPVQLQTLRRVYV